MNENFLIDTMMFSFSRCNYSCLHEFYLHYVECNQGIDSFFGQFGTFCHLILEKYANGELMLFDLAPYYTDHFDEEVWMDAPFIKGGDLKENYFYKGLEFFENLEPFLDNYKVLGVEKEIHFEVAGHEFIGYIDLLLREKKSDRIIIWDWKSGSLKLLKNGQVSGAKKEQEHFLEFKRQLYLYSIPIIKEYGKVDALHWGLFKDGTNIEIAWDEKEFKEALDWAEKQISNLYDRDEWPPKDGAGENDYYCRNLCGQREDCEYCRVEETYEY